MRSTSHTRSVFLCVALTLTATAATIAVPASVSAADHTDPVIRPGDGAPDAQLAPFTARYLHVANGEHKGERLTHLRPARFAGGDGWSYGVALLGTEGMVEDEIQFLTEDFQPILRRVTALAIKHQVEVWQHEGNSNPTVRGIEIAKDGATATPFEIDVEGLRFDGASLPLLLARLPLTEGYSASLPFVSSDFGADQANLWSRVHVTGRERVVAAGASFDAWKVRKDTLDTNGEPLMPPGTFWVTDRPPYLVKAEFGPLHLKLVELDAPPPAAR